MTSRLVEKRRGGHRLHVDAATSQRMAGVRRQDTSAEMVVRQIVHRLGHRFRLQNRDLPGSPDLANRSRKWAIFVHGCFWHRHGCSRTTTPKRNRAFWESKFEANVRRDRRVQKALRDEGFTVLVVWECDTLRDPSKLIRKLDRKLRR